jgi:hypothetical protein
MTRAEKLAIFLAWVFVLWVIAAGLGTWPW